MDDYRLKMVADIVAAYFSNNHVDPEKIGSIIDLIHNKVAALSDSPLRSDNFSNNGSSSIDEQDIENDINRDSRGNVRGDENNPFDSVRNDGIFCLECGGKFKLLAANLKRSHPELTNNQYRAKWNLSSDYPFTPSEYSLSQKKVADALGFGKKIRPAREKPKK